VLLRLRPADLTEEHPRSINLVDEHPQPEPRATGDGDVAHLVAVGCSFDLGDVAVLVVTCFNRREPGAEVA
jgi:hypothetical protein